MEQTFSFFSKRNVLMSFLLTGIFFLVGLNSANAQQTASGGVNPHTGIAQAFGVTAYPLGTFDQASTVETIKGILIPLKPLIGHGATDAQELQYAYLSAVLTDVGTYSIAVEISLLKRLEELKDSKHLSGALNQTKFNPTTQLANLYNQTVNAIQ
ncbi:MAG: hypothetical protein SH808_09395 [Saprospiraceae bacterium]|nr:hypothetical protein [Saprospiraceae bacterium]